MSEQKQYRFINKGETLRVDDEFFYGGEWRKTNFPGTVITHDAGDAGDLLRRPIEPTQWPEAISKDRYYPTEADCDRRGYVLGFEKGVWLFMTPGQFKEGNYTYWVKPPPALPAPKPDWEVAWMASNLVGGESWALFKAGYLAAQAQKGTK